MRPGRFAYAIAACFAGSLGLAPPAVAQAAAVDSESEAPAPIAGRFEQVAEMAAELAAKPYQPRPRTLPSAFEGLDYDAYRKLRPIPTEAAWRSEGSPFAILPLPRGFLYRDPVAVDLVEDGAPRSLDDVSSFFDFVDFPQASAEDRRALGLSGLRVLYRFDGPEAAPEAAVFQGASYFRAAPQGLAYGLSARALAVNAFAAGGEEFPAFTRLWAHRPAHDADAMTLVALVDSPSLAGAYEFVIRPGRETLMDVRASLHARETVANLGLAPMSSMYLWGAADRRRHDDLRDAVHDSDGLAIETAQGEHIWRPVTNPGRLEVSSFQASNVRGFGLQQRERSFQAFQDLEARYHLRPSLWVEPVGDWGEGEVVLAEIPTAGEYEDNIAALWRPAQPLVAGASRTLAYRLTWNAARGVSAELASVFSTRTAAAPSGRRFAVDFARPAAWPDDVTAEVWASSGAVSNIHITPHDRPDARRLVFDLAPGQADVVELRAALRGPSGVLSETWLFRWTPEQD
jgi:periplasmic glucans biosynthesis protein